SIIERYHEYRTPIRELLKSIVTGIADVDLISDQDGQRQAMVSVCERYPFVKILYVLNEQGLQISEFSTSKGGEVSSEHDVGLGRDRRHRPYFVQVKARQGVIVTEPYLSSADSSLCLTTSMPLRCADDVSCYLVLDANLEALVSFLLGDTQRRRFEPLFKAMYALLGLSLLGVVGLLMFNALSDLAMALIHPIETETDKLRPFSIIIVITLAMAIFDLAKTTLEEEVLMHKDVFRHSATRRTTTRFLASIIIAVSIEGLLLMFKSAMGATDHLFEAAFVMFSAALLTVALGVYVYLGARAEANLVSARKITQAEKNHMEIDS
ncbi:MAG TPA: general glycosylation pathway protein, partial [bacterium]|nr:general glycosylation pathway protein [bacterium]